MSGEKATGCEKLDLESLVSRNLETFETVF